MINLPIENSELARSFTLCLLFFLKFFLFAEQLVPKCMFIDMEWGSANEERAIQRSISLRLDPYSKLRLLVFYEFLIHSLLRTHAAPIVHANLSTPPNLCLGVGTLNKPRSFRQKLFLDTR